MSASQPNLQKPGAGLPFLQALVVKYWIMPRYSRKLSWEETATLFRREGDKILKAASQVPKNQLDVPVLVPPMRGIEDSSRFWSVSKTLEHLMTVGGGITEIIITLSHGRVPPIKVDVAKVKPKGTFAGEEAIRAFEKFVAEIPKRLETEVGDRSSKLRHPHPWFRPLTARQWHFLLASHQNIHRKQIEAIGKALNITPIPQKN